MYKIGDFSKKTNVPIKTLRYYDEINLFKPSYQDYFTGYRYYENNQIDEIKNIVKLKEINLTLEEIKEYLTTKNVNILLNKEKEFEIKVNAIKNYINENTYQIKEGTYEDYLKWNGLKMKNMPISLELRDNVCKYYLVFKNEEYYSDVFIFPEEENLINLNITTFFKDYIDDLLNYLSNKYDYITFKSDENVFNNLDIIREKCNCVDEHTETIKLDNNKSFNLTSIKVQLKK